ncbi:MAG: hypothetical protein WCD83_05585, partial [Pseudolabrys sp.]
MGKPKGKSKKVPTLDEFQENERWCRRNLQTSLEDIEAAFVVELPEVDVDRRGDSTLPSMMSSRPCSRPTS